MEKIFYRAIVFCSHPLNGYYKFEERFQIYPLDSDAAPKSKNVNIFPVVLEYWTNKTEEQILPEGIGGKLKEIISEHTHPNNYQRQILSLLSSLSNYRFSFPTPELKWFVEVPEGELGEVKIQSSRAGLSIYYYPEIAQEYSIKGFTELKIPRISFGKHPECFMSIDLDGTEEIKFSEHIDYAIHNYFALKDEVKKVINSATSLICNGLDLRLSMKSLSFISFVSSIETMGNFEFRNEEVKKCEACNSEAFRVIGKFRDYLFKYASNNPSTKKKIIEIYKLRSKIAHTGLLLSGDNMIDWGNDELQNDQWQTHMQAMQISRVSLMNWLLMGAKDTVQAEQVS